MAQQQAKKKLPKVINLIKIFWIWSKDLQPLVHSPSARPPWPTLRPTYEPPVKPYKEKRCRTQTGNTSELLRTLKSKRDSNPNSPNMEVRFKFKATQRKCFTVYPLFQSVWRKTYCPKNCKRSKICFEKGPTSRKWKRYCKVSLVSHRQFKNQCLKSWWCLPTIHYNSLSLRQFNMNRIHSHNTPLYKRLQSSTVGSK